MKILYCIIAFIGCAFCSASQIITTIAGNGILGSSGDGGPAINAELFPSGITYDTHGNLYIADVISSVIRKVDSNGIITRFAGNGLAGYSGDGGPATNASLAFDVVAGMTFDSVGNLFIACGETVRRIDTLGIISTVAGNNVPGYSGNGGPATSAEFRGAEGLCFDKSGNLYIGCFFDANVRMVNPSGIISTFAGGGFGYGGDGGPAVNALFKDPSGLAIDDSGNLYIADFDNDRIRKVNKLGIVTTFLGNPSGVTYCHLLEGCHASDIRVVGPIGVATDKDGNVYGASGFAGVVNKTTKDGLVFSIAGNDTQGYSGDGGPANQAALNNIGMICFDSRGDLIIADKNNNRVRKVNLGTVHTPQLQNNPFSFSVYPVPALGGRFACSVTSPVSEEATIVIKDIPGRAVCTASLITNTTKDFSVSLPPGLYTITAITKENTITKKLVIQ